MQLKASELIKPIAELKNMRGAGTKRSGETQRPAEAGRGGAPSNPEPWEKQQELSRAEIWEKRQAHRVLLTQ